MVRACAVAAAIVAIILPATRVSGNDSAAAGCDWPMYGHDPARTSSTTCAAAPTVNTARTLLPRWYIHTTDVVTASPSIAGGVVYAGAWDGTFYAVDLKTGRIRWRTVLGPQRTDGNADNHHGSYGVITSSAAIATIDGQKLVFVGAGGSMYALDGSSDGIADRQRVKWRFDIDSAHPANHGEIESSPVVWAGATGGPLVIFGADANQDSAFVGEGMWAVRAATGQPVWHFNPEAVTGHALYGCGNVWSSPALSIDPGHPALATLYFGTGDCPDNSTTLCPSDGSDPHCPPGQQYDYAKRWQQYAEAIIAISAGDGTPLWSYQPHVPYNEADDDFGSSAQLFTFPDGRPAVGEGNKDGTYSVLDRTTGHPIWHGVEQGRGNVQRGFAIGGFIGATAVLPVHGSPRIFGGSAIDVPFDFSTGHPVPSANPLLSAQPIQAFSALDGSRAWSAIQGFTYGGTSAANGVVYVGGLDTVLRAYDAVTGRLLWFFPTGAPISSTPAISSGAIVVGAGTSYTDLNFKLCDKLPEPLRSECRSTPLKSQTNPLSNLNGLWAFSTLSR